MKLAILSLGAFLLASPMVEPPRETTSEVANETPFAPASATFANEASCVAHLASLIKASPPPAYEAAVGPYRIAAGDTRAHRVKAQDWGHEIEEYRCLAAALSSRRWEHSMSDVKPFTIEDIRNMSFPAG